ncbi:hypothetical protein BH10PSE2_BH10PSE2_25650 [soil metagenome]
MITKTTLLTGIAALTLISAPAFAQDTMAPAAPSSAPAQTAPAAPGTLQLQPGSDVKGSDGTVLGKLEGVQNNAAGDQELTVRGTDGKLRGVPLGGLKPEGTGVSVAWSSTEYLAAPEIASPTPTAPSAPATDGAAAPEATPPTAATDPADTDAATAQEPTTEAPATAPEPQR